MEPGDPSLPAELSEIAERLCAARVTPTDGELAALRRRIRTPTQPVRGATRAPRLATLIRAKTAPILAMLSLTSALALGIFFAGPETLAALAQYGTPQTITFTSIPPLNPLVGGTYAVTATGGGSGNPVIFSIEPASTPGACSINGASVSFTGQGKCVIDANQAGNATYDPAPQVSQTVTIYWFAISATVGRPISGSLIAALKPPGGPGNVSQETATISWGDGSITQASLSIPAANPAVLDVSGTHTYWTAGQLPTLGPPGPPVAITLTNTQTGATQTFNGYAVVSSVYVAMGDSYSSGEGAGWPPGQLHPDLPGCDWQLYHDSSGVLYKGSTDHIDGAQLNFLPPYSSNACESPSPSVGNTCHRSTTAYAHAIDRLLAIESMTLDFVACSGALVQDAYSPASQIHHDQVHTGELPQVSALGSYVSLITLTFGGNNLNFAGVAANCAKGTLPPPAGTGPNDTFDCIKQDNAMLTELGYDTSAGSPHDGDFRPRKSVAVQQEGATGLSLKTLIKTTNKLVTNDLHDALVLLYRDLKAAAPGARILVLGYPRFFPPGGTGSDCEHFTAFDQRWVNPRIALADQIIQDAVFESGVAQYVDVYNALSNHEECTGAPNFSVDPATFQVAPCTGAWINGIDVLGAAFGTAENLHPNPCGHQAEGQTATAAYNAPPTVDTFALNTGQSHRTTVQVPSGAGIDRANFTTTWQSGSLQLTLTDPLGTTYTPIQQGPVYAAWDIPHPPSGTWTLTETNVTTGDTGIVQGTVDVNYSSIPFLPPAGQITLTNDSCGVVTCTATFKASVKRATASKVASYDWFDDQGNQLTNTSGSQNDMVQVDSFINRYRVILRTNGSSGEARYTAICSDGSSVTQC